MYVMVNPTTSKPPSSFRPVIFVTSTISSIGTLTVQKYVQFALHVLKKHNTKAKTSKRKFLHVCIKTLEILPFHSFCIFCLRVLNYFGLAISI